MDKFRILVELYIPWGVPLSTIFLGDSKMMGTLGLMVSLTSMLVGSERISVHVVDEGRWVSGVFTSDIEHVP